MPQTGPVVFRDQVLQAAGSLLSDEGRGDYPRMLALAGEALRTTRGSQPGELRAEAQLAAGWAALLAGAPGLARRRLLRVVDTGNAPAGTVLPAEITVSARTLAHLAYLQQWYFLPGGGSSTSLLDCRARTDVGAEIAAAQQRAKADRERVANAGMACLLGGLNVLAAASTVLGSDFVTSRLIDPEGTTALAESVLGDVMRLSELCQRTGWNQLGTWAWRMAARVADRMGDQKRAADWLNTLIRHCTDGGDLAGAACCLLLRADWNAAPLSGAMLLDLSVQESGTSGSDLSPLHDSLEATAAPAAVRAAHADLDAAESRYRQAGCPRGVGLVELHRAGLAFLLDDHAAHTEHARAAVELFCAEGDIHHGALASIHVAVADLGARGDRADPRPVQRAADAVLRGGGFSYGIGLAFLLARVGRHWLVRRRDRERALVAHQMAGLLADRLRAATTAAQSLVDRAGAWRDIGLVHQSTALLRQAMERYLAEADRHPPIRAACFRRGREAAHAALSAVQSGRDPAEIDSAIELGREVLRHTGADLDGYTEPDPSALANADHDLLGLLVMELALTAGLRQATLSRVLAAGRLLRESGSPDVGTCYETALSACAELPDAERDFWTAIVHLSWRQRGLAVHSYRRFVRHGEHCAATIGDFSASLTGLGFLTGLGEAGQRMLGTARHHLDQLAAEFFLTAKHIPLARKHLDRVQALAGPDWWRREPQAWAARVLDADITAAEGDLDGARRGFQEAIELLEGRFGDLSTDEHRIASGANRTARTVYLRAARNEIVLGHDADALALIERSRARALLDLATGTERLRQLPAEQAEAIRRWRHATARLAAVRRAVASVPTPTPELAAALAAAERDADERRRAAPDLGATGAAPILSATEIARRLPAESLLLTWASVEDDLLIITVCSDGTVRAHVRAVDTERLDGDLRAFTGACRDGTPDPGAGSRIAEALLSPVADQIDAARHVVFVPFGPALAAPLTALPFRGAALIANPTRTISLLPSASLLADPAAHTAAEKRPAALVVGDPARMAWRAPGTSQPSPAPALRYAQLEARVVSRLLGGPEPLLGDAADATSVLARLPRQRLLHLAAHSIILAHAPELSAILLADGGTLTVADLLGTDLRAQLVTLSACDTGTGTLTDGGEVLGLSRALLAAGAGCAVVSLWPVNDLSSCLLMAALYARIRAGEPSTTALANAQRLIASLAATQFSQLRRDLEKWLADGGDPQQLPALLTAAPPAAPRAGNERYWAAFIHIGLSDLPVS